MLVDTAAAPETVKLTVIRSPAATVAECVTSELVVDVVSVIVTVSAVSTPFLRIVITVTGVLVLAVVPVRTYRFFSVPPRGQGNETAPSVAAARGVPTYPGLLKTVPVA